MDRTPDRLGDVGDMTAAPDSQLISEQPPAPRPTSPDRSLANDAAVRAVAGLDGSGLDHIARVRDAYFERRVKEVARRSAVQSRSESFVDPAVQPHEVATRSKGEPEEVDS
jgi:hypothetical protein